MKILRMDHLVLDDASLADALFPFTGTRPVIDIRIGILTLREKWEKLGFKPLLAGERETGRVRQVNFIPTEAPLFNVLPANVLPTRELAESLRGVVRGKEGNPPEPVELALSRASRIQYPWDIFRMNGEALRSDFALLTKGRQSHPIPLTVQAIHPEEIFIEEGARISHSILNASAGPIYIGRNSEIMEGAMIRGPFALGEGAVVKMGAKIYGATTIGPYCTAGGEIKNSVLFGYSNKGHDGYLGDSVIGEWCNLGAGSSNSNIKNNAGPVKVWSQGDMQFVTAGTKCGLLMGDYSRCAINTSFNTGTVVGVCCTIFGEGLTPKFIPDFSWGTVPGTRYIWEKALQDIGNWKKLKNQSLTPDEIQVLKHIFERS